MKNKQIVKLLTGIFMFCSFGVVSATPLIWNGNGHYYEAVDDAANMAWEDARDWASGLAFTDSSGQLFKGYLATITSSEENSFIENLATTTTNQTSYLLGGFQTPPSPETDFAADWHWVTGEVWNFTNWRNGEPNNFFRWQSDQVGYGHSEEYLQLFPDVNIGWNDVHTGDVSDTNGNQFFGSTNFIVEYEAATSVTEPGILALMLSGLYSIGFMRKTTHRKYP